MRRVSLLLAVIALTGVSAGVVGGPNGTMWRTQISNVNNSCMSGNISQDVEFGSFTNLEEDNMTQITFSGVLSTSNPCKRVSMEVRDTGNASSDSYVVEFVEKSNQGICVSCIGAARFEGSFAAPGEYRVVFKNEGQEIATKTTPGFSEDSSGEESPDEDDPNASVAEGISRILSWLGSLF